MGVHRPNTEQRISFAVQSPQAIFDWRHIGEVMADERWGLVGAGQCGRRVAAAVCERATDSDIGARTVLVNSAPVPMRRTLDRLASALDIERPTASRDHLVTFEARAGLGQTIFDDPASATAAVASVAESIETTTADADAVLYALGLGGQIGNSAVPRVIDRLSPPQDDSTDAEPGLGSPAGDETGQVALGVWPFDSVPPRRHFDAVCGLSRLLRRPDGTPNADMTILASNARLSEIGHAGHAVHPAGAVGAGSKLQTDESAWITDVIADAIRSVIGSGQTPPDSNSGATPAALPHRTDARHGTVGVALEKPAGIDPKVVIRRAVENAFVPLGPATVETAHVVVRAPDRRVEAGDVTERGVREAFAAWVSDTDGPGPTGGATLSAVPGDGHTIDVLVFLGGFDLSPLLSNSRDAYERFKTGLINQSEAQGSDELIERVRRLEANLRAYCDAVGGE